MAKQQVSREIYVYADWSDLGETKLMGMLKASLVRERKYLLLSMTKHG